MSCWNTLGIDPTNDLDAIRAAYRALLPSFHPEDDPEGFQNLRKAYEQAVKLARAPIITPQPETEPENEFQSESEPEPEPEEQPEPSPVRLMLDEMQQLLDDPQRRFVTEAWQTYCRQLDSLSLEELEDLEEPLFSIVSNAGNISSRCVRLLAARMDWEGRQLRMPRQHAEEVDEFLRRLEIDDPFDLSLMQNWSQEAQLETLWYYKAVLGLFRHRSRTECRQFLEAHTVIPLPYSQTAIDELLSIATQVDIPLPSAYRNYRQRWQEDPRDADNLYLLARQSNLLDNNGEAFGYWRTLWLNHKQPHAADWLLQWCRHEYPDWLPLLIQAFDLPALPVSSDSEADTQQQLESPPGQSAVTVMRWYQAAQYELSDLAHAFIDWQLNNKEQALLHHLLADDGTDPLLGWYRRAWLLWRGDADDLENLIQQKLELGVLDRLLLDGFQRQARVQLQWMQQSTAIQTLRTWLLTRETPLPEQLFADPTAMKHLLTCMGRLRHYCDSQLHTLAGLLDLPSLTKAQLPVIIRQQISLHQHGLVLPELTGNAEERWSQQRQTLLLIFLLEQPEDFLEMLTPAELNGLVDDGLHPFQQLRQRLLTLQKPKDLLHQLNDENPLDALIRSRLKPTPQDLLQQPRLPTLDALFAVSMDIAPFNDGSINALLLYGALYLCQDLTEEQRQAARRELLRYDYDDPMISQLRDNVVDLTLGKVPRATRKKLGLDKDPYYSIWESFTKLADGRPPVASSLPKLQETKDNSGLALGLRLTATLLLSYSEPFILNNANGSDTPAWAFWRLNSRLSRKGFFLQSLFLGYAGYLMLPQLGWWSLAIVLPLWFTCALRRTHDTGQTLGFLIALLLLAVIFPLTLIAIIILLERSDPVPNEYGIPPGGKYPGMDEGLQSALRVMAGLNK